ncbi:MAG: superoxide dismutase [Pontiellaceae bacterium]|nr:superoxide dismutase [Pontiellaceae bacterium]MBN2786496.1 superoxide dismutase [Pontiellaceae bacterium]
MAYTLPELPYGYDALEPYIDARTMEIHHTKHHQAYITKVNDALQGTVLEGIDILQVIQRIDELPAEKQTAVRNNGGGHANHSLFWQIMGPKAGGVPAGELAEAINDAFGGFEAFKTEFSNAAATRFGSGWAWLCRHADGEVKICSTPNQDNPLMSGVGCEGIPILGLDVWEHAYYLNYQNRRPDYINAFFSVINWEKVAENYAG